MANATKSRVNKNVKKNTKKVEEPQESSWYYFYSQGCGWCKKSEPVVDELNKEGYNILKLDLAEPDNQKIANEIKKEYNKQCGTPWFINAETGEGVCGFREKDILLTKEHIKNSRDEIKVLLQKTGEYYEESYIRTGKGKHYKLVEKKKLKK